MRLSSLQVGIYLFAALGMPAASFAHGDLHEQIAALTKQIEKQPRNAELYLKRGELHRLHEEWRAAAADYDRAAELGPDLAAVDLARGKMLLASGQTAAAKEALDRFLTAHPDHADALVTRARTAAKLGEHARAAEDFTHAIAQFPRPEPEYYLERATATAAQGGQHLQEAVRGLEEGIVALGPVLTLSVAAIDLEVRLERFDTALVRLEALSARSPRKETWLARRGDILALAGRPAEAREAYDEALKAIEALPVRQRSTKATRELAVQVQKLLATSVTSTGETP